MLPQTVMKDSYKYFKHILKPNQDGNYSSFTIALKINNGSSKLFHSFEDPNPKSDSEYLTEEGLEVNNLKNTDQFFYLGENKVIDNDFLLDDNTEYYEVPNPEGLKGPLYLGVKGLEDENTFQIYIFNRSIDEVVRECDRGSKFGVNGDCTKYTECINGKLINRTCESKVPNFDVVSKECSEVGEATCYVGKIIIY